MGYMSYNIFVIRRSLTIAVRDGDSGFHHIVYVFIGVLHYIAAHVAVCRATPQAEWGRNPVVIQPAKSAPVEWHV